VSSKTGLGAEHDLDVARLAIWALKCDLERYKKFSKRMVSRSLRLRRELREECRRREFYQQAWLGMMPEGDDGH